MTNEDLNNFESLIRRYVSENRADLLISLFQSLKDQRDRAEYLVQAHLHTIKKLSESFANITEPATGRKVSETPVRSTDAPNPNPNPKSPKPPVRTMNKTVLDDLEL